jgi:hypothetical protein
MDVTAAVLARQARLCAEQVRKVLVHGRAPTREIDVQHRVFLGTIADAGAEGGSPPEMMSRTPISSASRTGSGSGSRTSATLIGSLVVREAIAEASTIGAGR